MDMVVSAVVGELVSRLISFVIHKSQLQTSSTNKISRLRRLLLRAHTVVEEAEGRRVTNHAMLLQLKRLREAMYRGYYMLDTTAEISQPPRPPKRGAEVSRHKLHDESDILMDDLEAMLEDMKEFLLVLMHCPIIRQPYDAYMFMERCMFGRRMEKEHIINFLLKPYSSLDVLPVVGPFYVGKNTLVEHACREEIVQRNFSTVLRFGSDDIESLATDDSDMDYDKKLDVASHGRSVIVVELVNDIDVVAWGKFHHYLRRRADNSKVILISRMDCVSSLGTVKALRLTRLHQEEYWYFFRVLAFGSANPYDHHPDLSLIAKEMTMEMDGWPMMVSTVARVLRANMNVRFWGRALGNLRKAMQMHIHVFGEDPREPQSGQKCLSYLPSFNQNSPLMFLCNQYKTRSVMQGGTPDMVLEVEDVLTTMPLKYGEEFDMVDRSHIPPYYNYVFRCVAEKHKGVDLGSKCHKRKRKR